MKRIFSVLSFFVLAACTPTGQTFEALPPAPSDKAAVSNTSSSEEQSSPSTSSSAVASAPKEEQTRVIAVTADNWSFTPPTFTVRKGERVELHITGRAGIHSFAIPALDINVPVAAGEIKVVTLPTDEAGAFPFRCAIPCGSGHKDMTGTVTIEE